MRQMIPPWFSRLHSVREALRGPQLAILALALALALAWFGTQALLLVLPFGLFAFLPRARRGSPRGQPGDSGQLVEMAAMLDRSLATARRDGRSVLCILLGIDRFDAVRARHGHQMQARIVTSCLDHLSHGLRQGDGLFDLGQGRFAVVLVTSGGPLREAAQRVTRRLQATLRETVDAMIPSDAVHVRACFRLENPDRSGAAREIIAHGLAALEIQPADETGAGPDRMSRGPRIRAGPDPGARS